MTTNFRSGVGRLATDRYDFQNHIDGNPPYHKASIITLDPAIVIDSVSCTNVQTAITQLAPFAVAVPDATISTKGIIQLAGDLSGTATNIIVSASKIQNRAVLTTPPTSGYVLTWNGSAWYPAAIPVQFVPGNDLQGTNTNQEVIGITGIADQTLIKCNTLQFDGELLAPQIMQEETIENGATLSILAQNSSLLVGGDVAVSGGYGASEIGGVQLQVQPAISTFSTLLHATSINNRRILGLVSNAEVTSVEMPANTGDLVVYLKNAATTPSTSPVSGCILYSSSGILCVKQSNGQVKVIGSASETTPKYYYGTYDDYGFPTEVRKFTVTSAPGTKQTIYSCVFDEAPNIVMAEIDAIGFTDDYAERYSCKKIITFESVAGGGGYIFSVLGSESVVHEKENTPSGSWTSSFYDTGFHDLSTITFMTGSHSLKHAVWSICIKLNFGYYT